MARQRALFAVDAHYARAAVDLEPAEAQAVRRTRTLPPAQDRSQAREQLARIERLRQVVVRAELETDDAVRGLAARGQHQDRDVGGSPDLAAHGEAVPVGQHEVEDERVERLAFERGEPVRGGLVCGHAKARLREIFAHHRGEPRIVLDDEDAIGHARLGWLSQATTMPRITTAMTSSTICFATTAPGIGCTA